MYPLLFFAALCGGALNAVAGGGSFIALPALMAAGVLPVSANATTTFALWPGSISSAIAYRREVPWGSRGLRMLSAISVAGGLLGGWLLIRTSDSRFLRLLPWLMLASALTFTFGGPITSRLRAPGTAIAAGDDRARLDAFPLGVVLFQVFVAIYGGYFGGGIGIMMLAALAVAGLTNMHTMNGIKALLAVAINGVAVVEFVASGAVAWAPGLVMAVGGIVGGYGGAAMARRVEPARIRLLAVLVAWLMTVYFFFR